MKFLLWRPLFSAIYECKKGVEIELPICVLCHLAKSMGYIQSTCISHAWHIHAFRRTPVKSTYAERTNLGARSCTATQSIKCAASQHEKRKKESEQGSPGSLTYPVHTRLILASNGSKTPKGRGECSMPGKGIEG